MMKRKALALPLVTVLATSLALSGCGKSESSDGAGKIYMYDWGEYIDDEAIDVFQEEAGIEVVYDMLETNEEMYSVTETGGTTYDTICLSNYMIQKMRENNLLAEINFSNVPNISEIDPEFMERSKSFDPENKYSVPYCWGTVGILYNTPMVTPKDMPTKQSDLQNDKFSDGILMQDSVRDAFMVALKSLEYSINTTDEAELQWARDLLIEQKPLVQAYVIDRVHNKMIGGETAIGVIYSGEMLYIQKEVENLGLDYKLEYMLPEEGINVQLNPWVIPASAKNREDTEKWINFLCRPGVARRNFEYATYATPNRDAFELLDEGLQNNKAVFPDIDSLGKSEVFQYLGDDMDTIYDNMWGEVKSK